MHRKSLTVLPGRKKSVIVDGNNRINYLGGVIRDSFGNDSAPAFIECLLHHSIVGAGRATPNHKRVW